MYQSFIAKEGVTIFTDIWVFILAVFFTSLNAVSQLAYAASLGYNLRATSLGYFVGSIGNILTGSVTPVSAQAQTLTVSGLEKNMRNRISGLFVAAFFMIILSLFGGVTWMSDFAGESVMAGMMSGVGLILAGAAFSMISAEKRTGTISMVVALITWAIFLKSPNNLVFTSAASVVISSLDFTLLQKRRVDVSSIAKNSDKNTKEPEKQKLSLAIWKKEFWNDFKVIKPTFNLRVLFISLSFICLNIGTNTAMGGITASIAKTTQNFDHLTLINSLADLPSCLFGGAPIEAIISGTANAPWPVLAGILMMAFTGILLLSGAVNKIARFVPAQSCAGFLAIIGINLAFVPNLLAFSSSGAPLQGAIALGLTTLTKNPFFGMAGGVIVKFWGHLIGLG